MSCFEILLACVRRRDYKYPRQMFMEEMVKFLAVRVKEYIDYEFQQMEDPDVETSKLELEKYTEKKLAESLSKLLTGPLHQLKGKLMAGQQTLKPIEASGKTGTDTLKCDVEEPSLNETVESDKKGKKGKSLFRRVFKLRTKKQEKLSAENVLRKPSFLQKIFKRK